jgi:undecaprenyl-diphosphatase
MSVTWALLLFLIFSPRIPRQYLLPFALFCLLFPLMIIFSRVYLGVHYFSDVTGGMTLGIFWVMLAAWYFGRHPFAGNSEKEVS